MLFKLGNLFQHLSDATYVIDTGTQKMTAKEKSDVPTVAANTVRKCVMLPTRNTPIARAEFRNRKQCLQRWG